MNLNLIAPISTTSYGKVGTRLTDELAKKTKLSLFPISSLQQTGISWNGNQCLQNSVRPDWNAPCVRLWHQHDMAQFVGSGLKVGFPIFETDQFSGREKHHLNHLDRILVCSEWAKRICLQELDSPEVYVAPLGVDANMPTRQLNTEGTYNFFHCGKWEYRKGHDKLVEAFCQAFGPDDDVMLHLMCDNPFLNYDSTNKWERLYSTSSMGHKIQFIDRLSMDQAVYQKMATMDCAISLSRAEGWNLPLLECMAVGLPVITTNYSAHTEYCTPENAMLIDIDQLETANDGVWFHGNRGRWAHLGVAQVEQAAQYMRKAYENRPTNEAGIETAKKLTWENTAQKVLQACQAK